MLPTLSTPATTLRTDEKASLLFSNLMGMAFCSVARGCESRRSFRPPQRGRRRSAARESGERQRAGPVLLCDDAAYTATSIVPGRFSPAARGLSELEPGGRCPLEERARRDRAAERAKVMVIPKARLGQPELDFTPVTGAAAISLATQLTIE